MDTRNALAARNANGGQVAAGSRGASAAGCQPGQVDATDRSRHWHRILESTLASTSAGEAPDRQSLWYAPLAPPKPFQAEMFRRRPRYGMAFVAQKRRSSGVARDAVAMLFLLRRPHRRGENKGSGRRGEKGNRRSAACARGGFENSRHGFQPPRRARRVRNARWLSASRSRAT